MTLHYHQKTPYNIFFDEMKSNITPHLVKAKPYSSQTHSWTTKATSKHDVRAYFCSSIECIFNDVRECVDQCADCFWVANLIGPLQEWNGLGHPEWEDMNYNNNSQFAWISAWFLGRPMRPIHVHESHSINDLSVKLKTDPKYCVSSTLWQVHSVVSCWQAIFRH